MKHLISSLAVVSIGLSSAYAHAQCTKDTDCKGDRVCDAGACQSPARVKPPDPNGWDVGAATAETADAANPEEKASAVPPAAVSAPPAPPAKSGAALETRGAASGGEERSEPPKMVRRSPGMMAAGIVIVSIAPIPLFMGALYALDGLGCGSGYDEPYERDCSEHSGEAAALTLMSLAMVGIGVPLIVMGAKRVPAKQPWQAAVLPFATPGGAGIGLRFKL